MDPHAPLRLLHVARRAWARHLWTPPFLAALGRFGTLERVENGADLPPAELLARLRGADILLTGHGAHPLPDSLAADLDALFASSDAVVITTALTPETRHSVDAGRLARLPDGGILVNIARGAILRQEDLLRELATGRLRAGLDVVDHEGRDWMPGHPATTWPNLLLTSHPIGCDHWPPDPERLGPLHLVCLDNLERFTTGRGLRFRITPELYDRMT